MVLVNKGRRSSHNSAQAKQGRVVKSKERTPLSTDLRGEGNDSALPTVQVTSADQVNLPTKARSRRKVDLQKPVIQNDSKSSESILNDHPSIQILSSHDRVLSLKVKYILLFMFQ